MGDSGIVHQNIYVTELTVDRCEHLFHASFVADIAGNREYADLLARQLSLNAPQSIFVATTHGQMAPFIAQGSRDCETDALRGPGYERDFAPKCHKKILNRGDRREGRKARKEESLNDSMIR